MSETEKKYPHVEIQNIENLGVAMKKGGVKISFDVKTPGPEILKLMWMAGTAQAMNITIESPEAKFNMRMIVVDIETGQEKE